MKLLSWLICTIVIALSFVPCADAHSYELSSSKISLNKSISHSTAERGLDTCSPFCVCACCNTTTIAPQLVFQLNIPLQLINRYFILPYGKVTSAIRSVWQPPQLG